MFFTRCMPLFFTRHLHSQNQVPTDRRGAWALVALALLVVLLTLIVPA